MTATTDTMPPTSGHQVPDPELPGGYRSQEAVRWAHVLTRMGVTCDPDDEPTSYHLLPEFGDGDGTAYYCGPYTRTTWPSCYVISACALIAAGQFARVVFLGDIAVPSPDIWIISRPNPEFAWLKTPFMASAQHELAFRRVPGGHVAACVTSSGQETPIGRVLRAGEFPNVKRSAAGVRHLLAEARNLTVEPS